MTELFLYILSDREVSNLAEAVTLVTCNRKDSGSNLAQTLTILTEVFCGFF
jgi:hypothetical protein